MATNGKNAGKPAKKGLLAALRAAGHGDGITEQKTKLWDRGDTIISAEELSNAGDYVQVRKSLKYDNSIYIRIGEGTESKFISFIQGEIEADDFEADDNGIIENFNVDYEVIEVTAMRDDEELGITKGDTDVRCVLI
jgi:hypothetical protein